MNDKTKRLRMILSDRGSQSAFVEVLRSELTSLLSQYLTVEDVTVSFGDNGLDIKVIGGEFKNVGFYWG